MTVVNKRFEPESQKVRLFVFSDVHIGNEAFNEKTFKDYIDWVRDHDDTYCILGGDIIESSNPHEPYCLKLNPQEQIDKALELLSPIKRKILASTGGNHEGWIKRETGVDVAKLIARSLDTIYCENEIFLRMKVLNEIYTLYFIHGKSTSTTLTGKVNTVRNLSQVVDADVIGMGHMHGLFAFPIEQKVYDSKNKKLTTRQRYIFNSGSFLGGAGYAVRAGLSPEPIGAPVLHFYKNKREKHATTISGVL